jgi:hypothetical protein
MVAWTAASGCCCDLKVPEVAATAWPVEAVASAEAAMATTLEAEETPVKPSADVTLTAPVEAAVAPASPAPVLQPNALLIP